MLFKQKGSAVKKQNSKP